MARRKWKKSSVRVRDIHGLIDCLTVYHGVWCILFGSSGRFANMSWVQNQQLRVLMGYVGRGYFYYPEPVEGVAK